MKTRPLNWHWIVMSVILLSIITHAETPDEGISAAQKSLEKVRLELQAQGFKTDLTNFDFSTSAELRAREAVLQATAPNRDTASFVDYPDLMETAGSTQVIVVWKQEALKRQTPSWPDAGYVLTWEDFQDAMDENQPQIAAAYAAILAGPIQFNLNASAGNAMLLPHLALLKKLTQTFNGRIMLALHDGDRQAAWTNLLAATRLVTAWNPEPAMVSHRVRFENARLMFNATWQALQTNGWADDQLERLQREWETADFLDGLPEIPAFQSASDVELLKQTESSAQTPEAEMDEQEEHLLLFYRDRESEFRNAVQAGSWKQMREMPGVTNEPVLKTTSPHRGRFEIILNQRRLRAHIRGEENSFLGRAAEAEAERRMLVTVLALERYCGKHGRYPETLPALAPEFVKSVPADFMTGQSLHYRVAGNGRFLLYSAGMDCEDNGGKIQTRQTGVENRIRFGSPSLPVSESDIVWPLAASPDRVIAFRKAQAQAEVELKAQQEASQKAEAVREAQEAEKTRQTAMKRLLAEKPSLGREPIYEGKPLSLWVIKAGQIEEYNGAPEDAVAAIRAIGSKAVPFLLEWMPQPGVGAAVEGYPGWDGIDIAWWALGSNGNSAIPILERNLSTQQHTLDDQSVWTEDAKAISYLGADAIIPMLTVATNMAGKHDLWELLHNFGNLGTNGTTAVPALIHWANDPDSWIRDGVVSALGEIGERPDLAIPVLTNALHDSDSMVRRDAGEALGSFANDSEAVLPQLIQVVKNPPDWQARAGALSGLGKIQNKVEIVVPIIVPFLDDDNSVLERYAAYALRDLGSEAGFEALLRATNNPNIGDIIYEVRRKAHHEGSK